MRTPTIAELLGDEAEFFRAYFNVRPMLRRAALTGDPTEVLSVSDLDDILHSEAIRTPYVALSKGGRPVVPGSYTMPVDVQDEYVTGCVDAEKVAGHFRTGATITWNQMNHFRPNLRALTASLTRTFGGRSDVVAFLTPAGKQGYPPHHDPVDVFVVQLEGRKRWQVWPTPEDRLTGTTHPSLDELGEPLLDTALAPGDVLYMPYGTPHVAAACDGVSLHLSVLVRPRPWADLLTDVVGRLLRSDPAFAGRPHPAARPAEALGHEFRARCELLAEALAKLDTGAELERLLPPGPVPGVGSRRGRLFQHLLDADRLTPDTEVHRRAAARVARAERRLAGCDPTMPTVLVNHFPLVREPTLVLHHPEFAQWCGTERTADWHVRYRAVAAVYGHLHIPRTTWHDGVRFEEVSLGYPREWSRRAGPVQPMRRVLPAPPPG